jgi:hydrogenase-1 operon protein HyaF
VDVVALDPGLAGCGAREGTGNVPLLLAEVRHALARLADDGSTHVIDLRAIPLGPGEEDTLLATLGRGELHAEFDALGRTEIVECAYPGVWLVTHRDAGDAVVGRFLEITYSPALLASPPEDVRAGLERLTAELAA